MLEGYVSEKEQIESIKKWWQENGKFLALAILMGLIIGFGWRYWHTMERNRAENASIIYQSILNADAKKQFTTAQGGSDILMQHFSSFPYASLAALVWAKEAVSQNNLSVALSKLQWVIDHGEPSALRSVAAINTARILLSQHKPQAALSMVNKITDTHFEPLVNWIKGDSEAQLGDVKKSQAYYQS